MFSIRNFLDSMFKKTWSVNHEGFIGPGDTPPQTKTWFCIDSLCDSASTLIRCNQPRQAHRILLEISPHLDVLAKNPDPLFLGKIWHLALLLRSMDRRAPGLQALSTLLRRLKSSSASLGVESPTSIIITSIASLDETDFTPTMRLGFHETLAVLDHKVKDENIAMLRLWSTYAQYFSRGRVKTEKKKPAQHPQNPPKSEKKAKRQQESITSPRLRLVDHIRRDILLEKFSVTWNACYHTDFIVDGRETSDNCILLSCYQAYAALWICEDIEQSKTQAQYVIEGTKEALSMPHLVWSVKALAFVIATKVLAEIHHRQKMIQECEEVMQNAIDRLANGDETCRIRAMSMCLTLVAWRQGREAMRESQEAENRLLVIQNGLEGFDLCTHCRPSLKCDSCFQGREACPKCTLDNGRNVCRTCKRAWTRRRKVMQSQHERRGDGGPTGDSSANTALQAFPSSTTSRMTAIHRQFSVSGLSPSLTYHELLGAIRETGRIFSSNISPSPTTPHTSTASIIFWDDTAADKFWQRHESQGLRVGDYSGLVTQSVIEDLGLSRDTPGAKRKRVPSRVLVVTGLTAPGTLAVDRTGAGQGAVKRVRKRPGEPTPRLTQEDVLALFKASCTFEIDEIIFPKPGEATSIEVRFSSWYQQSHFCMKAHGHIWKEFGVEIKYGRDPCAAYSYST